MRKAPTEEQKRAAMAKRIALGKLSDAIRPLVKAGMYDTINEGLEDLYRKETGQAEFHTFMDWRNKGFFVVKGATGYPIWSRPMEYKAAAADAPTEAELIEEQAPAAADSKPGKSRMTFRMAYLFHAGQVADRAGNKPESAGKQADLLTAAEELVEA